MNHLRLNPSRHLIVLDERSVQIINQYTFWTRFFVLCCLFGYADGQIDIGINETLHKIGLSIIAKHLCSDRLNLNHTTYLRLTKKMSKKFPVLLTHSR